MPITIARMIAPPSFKHSCLVNSEAKPATRRTQQSEINLTRLPNALSRLSENGMQPFYKTSSEPARGHRVHHSSTVVSYFTPAGTGTGTGTVVAEAPSVRRELSTATNAV